MLSTPLADWTPTRETSFVVAVCSSAEAAIAPDKLLSFSIEIEISEIASTAAVESFLNSRNFVRDIFSRLSRLLSKFFNLAGNH